MHTTITVLRLSVRRSSWQHAHGSSSSLCKFLSFPFLSFPTQPNPPGTCNRKQAFSVSTTEWECFFALFQCLLLPNWILDFRYVIDRWWSIWVDDVVRVLGARKAVGRGMVLGDGDGRVVLEYTLSYQLEWGK